jgi:DNA invertase Pin-like site-specific DNA recombinase
VRNLIGSHELFGRGSLLNKPMGVFVEFERSMIQERVRAGLARAKDEASGA